MTLANYRFSFFLSFECAPNIIWPKKINYFQHFHWICSIEETYHPTNGQTVQGIQVLNALKQHSINSFCWLNIETVGNINAIVNPLFIGERWSRAMELTRRSGRQPGGERGGEGKEVGDWKEEEMRGRERREEGDLEWREVGQNIKRTPLVSASTITAFQPAALMQLDFDIMCRRI